MELNLTILFQKKKPLLSAVQYIILIPLWLLLHHLCIQTTNHWYIQCTSPQLQEAKQMSQGLCTQTQQLQHCNCLSEGGRKFEHRCHTYLVKHGTLCLNRTIKSHHSHERLTERNSASPIACYHHTGGVSECVQYLPSGHGTGYLTLSLLNF